MPTASPHLAHAPAISAEGSGNWRPVGGLIEHRNNGDQCPDGVGQLDTIVGFECPSAGDEYLDVEGKSKEWLGIGSISVFNDVLHDV